MVKHFFPQNFPRNLSTNTNHPPQSSEEPLGPLPTVLMEYEDLVDDMSFEDGVVMEYQP